MVCSGSRVGQGYFETSWRLRLGEGVGAGRGEVLVGIWYICLGFLRFGSDVKDFVRI